MNTKVAKWTYFFVVLVIGTIWLLGAIYTEEMAKEGDASNDAATYVQISEMNGEAAPVQASGSTTVSNTEDMMTSMREPTPSPEALSVRGTKLVDSSGNPVQLRGISTHGLAWYPDYVNQECFQQLKEWGANVVRLAMYTAEHGGYCTGGDKEALKSLVKDGVSYATACDLYVIIDWHILSDGNPNSYIEDAKEFFEEMSKEYADLGNVFYEICNEPNGETSWQQVKTYAEQVIDIIRANDEDGVILVGTPNWCQYVEQAAADPIQGYDNIMYTLHFYAATHTTSLRNSMTAAIDAGLPIFVSEFGICDASGNGKIDVNQADRWVSVMDEYEVSYVAWNLSNKAETSAILNKNCYRRSGFTQEDLSASGKWVFETLSRGGAGEPHPSQTSQQAVTPEASPGAPLPGGTTGAMSQEIALINSWGQGDESYYQYNVTIYNNTGIDCHSWKLQIPFNQTIVLQNGWNGIYEVEDNVLMITPMDYNQAIIDGGSVGDIGFILRSEQDLAPIR